MAFGKHVVLLGLVMMMVVVAVSHAATEAEAVQAANFLRSFGYMDENNMMGPSEIQGNDDFKHSITAFQRFYKLNVTGIINAETMTAMEKPRCGVPDPSMPTKDGNVLGGRLEKRYAFAGGVWEEKTLRYRIRSYPRGYATTNVLTTEDVSNIIDNAFKIWSDQIPLSFQRVESGYAEIYLDFGRQNHGDLYPFDGPNGVLAHAYIPGTFGDLAGDVHFDDDEYFSKASYYGYNLLQVAAHEIGHSLGLAHSDVQDALMYPAYTGYKPGFTLPRDDIRGIQALYGIKNNPNPGEPAPTYTSGDAEGCNKAFSAVGYLRGEIFGFQNDKYWRIRTPGMLLTDPDGEDNKYFWDRLPDNVDANYERYHTGEIIFFKGEDYYVYYGNTPIDGPLKISDLTSEGEPLPNNIDAVVTFGEYYKTFFFKGDQVWRYDEQRRTVDPGYPYPISVVFKGLPNDVTAGFRYNDRSTYFLKGREYYRYNDDRKEVEYGYPRFFGVDFMGCTDYNLVGNDVDNGTATVSVVNLAFVVIASFVSVLLNF